jgi:hypothetical protein
LLTSLLAVMKLLLLAAGLVLLQLFRAAVTELLEHWLIPAAGSECWLLLYWLLLAAGLHRGLTPPLLHSSARSQLVRLQPVDLLSFLLERRRRFVLDVPPT